MTSMPIKDAATYLGVSVDTIRRRHRRGELDGEFVNGRWMIDVPDRATSGNGLDPLSQYTLGMMQEEIRHLREENLRLLSIVARLTNGDTTPAS